MKRSLLLMNFSSLYLLLNAFPVLMGEGSSSSGNPKTDAIIVTPMSDSYRTVLVVMIIVCAFVGLSLSAAMIIEAVISKKKKQKAQSVDAKKE